MAVLRTSLTDREIAKFPLASDGQYVVRDKELKGFFLVIGKRTKTFTIHGESWKNGKRKPVHMALGVVGDITAKEARLKARDCLSRIARGLPPIEVDEPADPAPPELSKPTSVTLNEAWERYREAHLVRKGRSTRTIESYGDHVVRMLADWKDIELKVLGEEPGLVAAKHDALTKSNGPYIANGAMRTLRAIYNHARKSHRYLAADNPVDAIDWNQESRRDTGMGLKALPGWFEELYAFENPLRREFHLFTLLSGCRPGALKVAEIEHLDFARRMLHVPAPKGGAKKAFDIPLSRPMVRCLIRAIRLGRVMHPDESERWIFAADSLSGHLVEQKEDRAVLSKWGNDLRQTFRTLGQAAEISPLDIHILMNHALQGVNAGYITKSALLEDHLRRQQERISRTILQAVENGRSEHHKHILAWLRSSRAEASVWEGQADRKGPPPIDSPDKHDAAETRRVRTASNVKRGPPIEERQRPLIRAEPLKIRGWAGDVAGSSRLERDYGISRSTLHGWQKHNRVVGLLTGLRKHVYPLAQFVDGRPVEGLAEIIAAASSPRIAWQWLVEPHSALGARPPLDRLKAGQMRVVCALAVQDFSRE